jgi:hypothetical protein
LTGLACFLIGRASWFTGPLGLKLDYEHIEKTRPEIAALLR